MSAMRSQLLSAHATRRQRNVAAALSWQVNGKAQMLCQCQAQRACQQESAGAGSIPAHLHSHLPPPRDFRIRSLGQPWGLQPGASDSQLEAHTLIEDFADLGSSTHGAGRRRGLAEVDVSEAFQKLQGIEGSQVSGGSLMLSSGQFFEQRPDGLEVMKSCLLLRVRDPQAALSDGSVEGQKGVGAGNGGVPR